MPKFTDNKDTDWTVQLTVGGVRDVRIDLGVDLFGEDNRPNLEPFINDPKMICDLLYVLCKEQAEKLELSDREFGHRLHGEALEQGLQAILEAMRDFFHFPAQREAVGEVIDATMNAIDRNLAREAKAIKAKLTPEAMDKEIAEAVASRSGSSYSSSPELSG